MERSLKSAFASLFGAKLSTSIISIVSLPVVVRLLGDSGYGDYAFLVSTFSLLMILVSSGVTEGVQKFVAEDRDLPDWREHVIGFYLKVAVVLAIAGSGLLVLATSTGLIAAYFGEEFEVYFYLLAAFVVAAQLRAFSRRTLMGLGLERYSEPLHVGRKLVWVALGVALALRGFGVSAFLFSSIVGALVVAVGGLAIVALRYDVRAIARPRPEGFPTRELLSFNGLNIVLVLLFLSLFHVDVVMLRIMTTSSATGLYKAALAIAEYVWFVPLVLQTLLLHSTSALWSEKRVERITTIAASATRYVLLLTALLAIGLVTLADEFVPLYFGTEFTGAVLPLVLLMPGTVGFALARPLYAVNQGSGRLRPLIAATGVAALLNVVLNYVLIPRYGIAGAAVATSTGYGSMFLLQVGVAHLLGYSPLDDLRPVRSGAAIATTVPVVYALDALLTNAAYSLILVPLVGALVFGVAVVVTGAVDRNEVGAALSSLPAPLESRLRALATRVDVSEF